MNILFNLLPISAFLGPAISWDNFYLYHLIALAILGYFGTHPKELKRLINLNLKINKIWIAIFTYSIMSLLWTPLLIDGLKYCAYVACGVFLVFIMPYILDSKKKQAQLLNILGILFGAHLVISMLEIFTPFRWPISEYSYLARYFGRDVGQFPEYFEKYPTSFFWHQNNCALITLMSLPFLTMLPRRLSVVAMLLSYLVIFYTGSKSIIVISGIFAVILICKQIKLKKDLKSLGMLLGSVISISLLGFYLSNSMQREEFKGSIETVANYARPLGSFLEAKLSGKDFDFNTVHGNIRERFFFMDGAIDLYKKSPILGIGAGGNLSALYTKNSQNTSLGSIHNYWLEILVIFGPFIALLYFIWLVRALYRRSIYSASLCLFIFAVPVLSSAIYFLPAWLLYGLCAADENLDRSL